MVRTTVLIVIALLMSGCGLMPRTGTPSEALTIADAMSVPATDIPKAKYTEMVARRNGAGDGRNLDNTVAGAAQLMASGDPTMLLLSGFTPRGISSKYPVCCLGSRGCRLQSGGGSRHQLKDLY